MDNENRLIIAFLAFNAGIIGLAMTGYTKIGVDLYTAFLRSQAEEEQLKKNQLEN